jgi:hypothetical protein
MALTGPLAKPPLDLKPASRRCACPANPSVLIRAGGLMAVIAAVILVLPPLSNGSVPDFETSVLGIVSPSGDVGHALPANMARRQPPPHPVLREGRLAALSGPSYTATTSPRQAAVRGFDAAPASALPAPQPPRTAALTAPPAVADGSAPDMAAFPTPRPDDLGTARAAASSDSEATVDQARRLLARGHLVEGRALLKQAAGAGNSHAATVLAKTYDPAVLRTWHVKGAKVDPAEARHWYQKAEELGTLKAGNAAAGRLQ